MNYMSRFSVLKFLIVVGTVAIFTVPRPALSQQITPDSAPGDYKRGATLCSGACTAAAIAPSRLSLDSDDGTLISAVNVGLH